MNNFLKYLFFIFFSTSYAYSAIACLIQTAREVQYGVGATCSDNFSGPAFNGWFNYFDQQYAQNQGVNPIKIRFTGLNPGSTYYLWYNKKAIGGGDSNQQLVGFYVSTDGTNWGNENTFSNNFLATQATHYLSLIHI